MITSIRNGYTPTPEFRNSVADRRAAYLAGTRRFVGRTCPEDHLIAKILLTLLIFVEYDILFIVILGIKFANCKGKDVLYVYLFINLLVGGLGAK